MEKLKIGPYTWEIIEKPEKDFPDFGEANLDKLIIIVRENLPEKVKKVTIAHEILHALFSSNGILIKQEELVVDFLASQLFIFLEQNSEFIKKFFEI